MSIFQNIVPYVSQRSIPAPQILFIVVRERNGYEISQHLQYDNLSEAFWLYVVLHLVDNGDHTLYLLYWLSTTFKHNYLFCVSKHKTCVPV